MTATRRKRLLSIGTFGVLLTLLVLTADWAGKLEPLERALYDLRVRRCQRYAKPPTDKLIHIDIDDGALAQVDQWPWDRSRVADLIEEMSRAGAKVIVLDMLFDRPASRDIATTAGEDGRVDHDRRLAEAIAGAGNVLLACSLRFPLPSARDPMLAAVTAELRDNLERSPDEVLQRMARQGALSEETRRQVAARFIEARAVAMRRRIATELAQLGPDAAPDEIRAKLLPNAGPRGTLARQFAEEYARVMAARGVRTSAAPRTDDTPALLHSDGGLLPLAQLSAGAKACAFIDYLREGEGVVRSIPMAADFDGAVLHQISLTAACVMMDVDVRTVRVTEDAVTIPRPGGQDVRLPIRPYPRSNYAGTSAFFDIPLAGRSGPNAWTTMYDFPRYEQPAQRMSVIDVWKAVEVRRRIETNEALATAALRAALRVTDPGRLDELVANPPPTGAALRAKIDGAVADMEFLLDSLGKQQNPTEAEKRQLATLRGARRTFEAFARQAPALEAELAQHRAPLAERLGGRAVFVGSVATAAFDFVPNSLDPQCPGVYLHGAAFNAIMTGEFWRVAPRWATVLAIVGLGLLTTAAVAMLTPPQAFASVLLLAAGYGAFNGFVLFDRNNLIVGAAGPLVAAGVVWSGITLLQFIREVGERARLTRRFSSYVDPTLVNYVIENPEQARLEAHEKEMTVAFTDLAGFTTLSEKLRAQSAKMLGQYMEAMVPLIRARRGYVNKFLGDGIMFFFGAPIENPNHAADAVSAVLDMEKALVPFNAELERQGLPTLSMRAGVTTGMMVVGDAGPSFASDYTVLGDAVNLAARLEGANKAFGTDNLITARTVELLGGRFVVRPIANLLVVGKAESVFVHEAMAPVEAATDEQKRLAKLTAEMVDAFGASRFDECLAAATEIERLFGPSKLTARYTEEATARRTQPLDAAFRGQIQLFAK